MDTDERSIDDLIAIAEEIPATMGLTEGMAEIRGTAQGEGIALEVDLQGMLVELELTEQALALGPDRLAAELTRLSSEASFDSLQQGLDAIEAGCGVAVASAVGDYINSLYAEPEDPEPDWVDENSEDNTEAKSWTKQDSW